jgi:hypothetical protein
MPLSGWRWRPAHGLEQQAELGDQIGVHTVRLVAGQLAAGEVFRIDVPITVDSVAVLAGPDIFFSGTTSWLRRLHWLQR